ncbi:MAG: sensor histidine kinase [Halofilum sp. (in: g-proteobacteria)]|nr:sensor histidine kinase [Halofilum sp. (in: g-proteobacteria)]
MNTELQRGEFLPDFCEQGNLLRTILMAELLVFVLVAARPGSTFERLETLALLTLFVQWIAMVDLALLCSTRHLLTRLDDRLAATLAFALLQAVTIVFTVIGFHALRWLGLSQLQDPLVQTVVENTVISAVVTAVALRYFYVTAEWRRKIEAFAHARVQALQARIRPHFLFNSMNTIASLTRSAPEAAERAVEDLSELFRASLGDQSLLTVADEIELARSYLRIEQERLGDRLQVEWDLDPEARDVQLPALTLQPLVENAVYHGIEPMAAGGTIRIHSRVDGDAIRIDIDNPVSAQVRRNPGHRMAQDNVRQRLAYAFGEAGALAADEEDGQYRVSITAPLRTEAGK